MDLVKRVFDRKNMRDTIENNVPEAGTDSEGRVEARRVPRQVLSFASHALRAESYSAVVVGALGPRGKHVTR